MSLAGLRVGLPFEDSDLDGSTDLQEHKAGTDAANASSRLELAAAGVENGSGVLRFDSVAGRQYRLQYKLDLSANAPWTDLPQTWAATGGMCTVTGLSGSASAAFYRLRLAAP